MRGTKDLSPGQAFDKLMALQDSLARREQQAVEEVRQHSGEQAARILQRVPEAQRERVLVMLRAAPEAERLASELVKQRAIDAAQADGDGDPLTDILGRRKADDVTQAPDRFAEHEDVYPDEVPERLMQEPPPLRPGERLVGRARGSE